MNNPLPLNALREFNRSELTDVLDSIHGCKSIVLDPLLTGPLNLICEFSLLQDHGVDKIFQLVPSTAPPSLPNECTAVLYFCPPHLDRMHTIAEHIKHNRRSSRLSLQHYLYFTPRRSITCEHFLEEEGVYGDLILGEFYLEWVPLDSDLLTLAVPPSFTDLFVRGDVAGLYPLAQALLRLQKMYGVIPELYGKGSGSQYLIELMVQLRDLLSLDEQEDVIYPEIQSLIILDRTVDLVTPLLSQLTFEGLVDESIGVKYTVVELDAAIALPKVASETSGGVMGKKKVALNSKDGLYSQLRDLNFSRVGPLLNQTAKRLNSSYEERHQAKTVSAMKAFVSQLSSLQQEHQALGLYTRLAEYLSKSVLNDVFHEDLQCQQSVVSGVDMKQALDVIERRMATGAPFDVVLRLFCLYSVTQNGLPASSFDQFRDMILQAYGYEHVFTLDALNKCGLFSVQSSNLQKQQKFANIRKTMRLVVVPEDAVEPHDQDLSYLYSGYAPLSCRLIESLSRLPVKEKEFLNVEEVWKSVPGPTTHVHQRPARGVTWGREEKTAKKEHRGCTAVLFLGGCTSSEVSGLRFLSEQQEGDYLILTTEMMNGRTLMEELARQTLQLQTDPIH